MCVLGVRHQNVMLETEVHPSMTALLFRLLQVFNDIEQVFIFARTGRATFLDFSSAATRVSERGVVLFVSGGLCRKPRAETFCPF